MKNRNKNIRQHQARLESLPTEELGELFRRADTSRVVRAAISRIVYARIRPAQPERLEELNQRPLRASDIAWAQWESELRDDKKTDEYRAFMTALAKADREIERILGPRKSQTVPAN